MVQEGKNLSNQRTDEGSRIYRSEANWFEPSKGTLLEVLEHIPQVEKAIENAVRIAREYVIVSVPSKEDDNEEHIHLLTKERLTAYFNACGIKKLSFDGVPGHLFMIAKIGE